MKRRNFLATSGLAFLGITNACSNKDSNLTINSKKRQNAIKTDVLVVGGGPAGIGAAIGAAKAGAKVLLIENYGFLGGVASWGMGMVMNQMRPDGQARGSIHEMLIERLQSYGEQAVRIETHALKVNVDYLKVALLDILDEAGCKYLVHAKAVDTILKNNKVKGVTISTKSGLVDIHANAIVDCTGDADISYFAGAPTMIETGNLSPQTLLLNVSNMEAHRAADLRDFLKIAQKKYPLIPDLWGIQKVSNCNHHYINHSGTKTIGNFDITDPLQFSEAECQSRRQVIQMVQSMREFGYGDFKDCEIVGASPQIGVRESRRIKGDYILTEEDSLSGKKFDDVIAWRSGYLDVGFTRVSRMKIHQVPYRSIVPLEIDGLLAAGRCISATHVGASAGKSMGNCFATGQAAGIAAALSSITKKEARELKVSKIQGILTTQGVDLTKGGEEQDEHMTNG